MNFPFEGVYFLFNPLKWVKKPWQENLCEIFPFLSALQLRSPQMSREKTKKTALELKKILEPAGIPLIINNYPCIADSLKASGVHLGIEDMPLKDAKNIFSGIIGASRHTPAGARQAEKSGASYIGAGPVFPTSTKSTGRDCLGPEGFLKIKNSVKIPVIPIGGINPKNKCRLDGISKIIAVSASLNTSPHPAKTAGLLIPGKRVIEN